jgi:hypothetical protein
MRSRIRRLAIIIFEAPKVYFGSASAPDGRTALRFTLDLLTRPDPARLRRAFAAANEAYINLL